MAQGRLPQALHSQLTDKVFSKLFFPQFAWGVPYTRFKNDWSAAWKSCEICIELKHGGIKETRALAKELFNCFRMKEDPEREVGLICFYLKQCLSTGCIVLTRMYQNFPGLYHRDVMYQMCALQEQIVLYIILFALAQCDNLFHVWKPYLSGVVNVCLSLPVCNVGQVTITYPFFVEAAVGSPQVGKAVYFVTAVLWSKLCFISYSSAPVMKHDYQTNITEIDPHLTGCIHP